MDHVLDSGLSNIVPAERIKHFVGFFWPCGKVHHPRNRNTRIGRLVSQVVAPVQPIQDLSTLDCGWIACEGVPEQVLSCSQIRGPYLQIRSDKIAQERYHGDKRRMEEK